ncbi:hypothetical protein LQZ21_03430 [Treponema sp. TIM-1]|uniref:DNA-directed RNA polymerase subunit alpha C-terminal domain-containing protein n=1 Tax=Treponema sp. TIM-1 TaxID=2898417 RepID=UPI00397FBD46
MEEVPIVSNAQEDDSATITIFSPETPISRLGFSQRSLNALTKSGYNTVALLLTLDEDALRAIENFGKKSVKEIRIVQERLQRQTKTMVDDRLENMNIPDCRFVYTKEISKNWQGVPLTSTAVVIALIGSTRTETGLTVRCVLDENEYETGLKVADDDFGKINISAAAFHGEWNYTISPNNQSGNVI